MPTVQSKEAANYQSQPNGPEHCGTCEHAIQLVGAEHLRCRVVSGLVDWNGWCRWWTPVVQDPGT